MSPKLDEPAISIPASNLFICISLFLFIWTYYKSSGTVEYSTAPPLQLVFGKLANLCDLPSYCCL